MKKPEINSLIHSQLIFDKDAKNIHWGKDGLCNKRCWGNRISICRRIKVGPYFLPYTKINSKCVEDLHVRSQTIKLLEENIGETVPTLIWAKNSKAQATKQKIDK